MDPRFFRKYADLITEAETAPIEEGWKDAVAGGALAASLALGGGANPAQAADQLPTTALPTTAQTQQVQQGVTKDASIMAAQDYLNRTLGTNISVDGKADTLVKALGGSDMPKELGPMRDKWISATDTAGLIGLSYNIKPGNPKYVSLHDAHGQKVIQDWLKKNGYNMQGKYVGTTSRLDPGSARNTAAGLAPGGASK
jgi:hypothetical protein